MYKINDFSCQNSNCINYETVIELMHKADEIITCPKCDNVMHKHYPNPVGYVKGTNNPVRYAKYGK